MTFWCCNEFVGIRDKWIVFSNDPLSVVPWLIAPIELEDTTKTYIKYKIIKCKIIFNFYFLITLFGSVGERGEEGLRFSETIYFSLPSEVLLWLLISLFLSDSVTYNIIHKIIKIKLKIFLSSK